MSRIPKSEITHIPPTDSEKRSSDAQIEMAFKDVTREADQESFETGFEIVDQDIKAEQLERQARAARAVGYKLRAGFNQKHGAQVKPIRKRAALVEDRVQKIKAWLRNRGVIAVGEIGKHPGRDGGWKLKCRIASERWAITTMSEHQFDHAYKLALSEMAKEDEADGGHFPKLIPK